MPLITVTDSAGAEHQFEAPTLAVYHDYGVARVYDRERRVTYGSFSNPIAVIVNHSGDI